MTTPYLPNLERLGLRLGDGKKKIFIQDKTSNKPLKKFVSLTKTLEEPAVVEPVKKKKEWRKMTARKYILTLLYDNPMSTEELAQQYIKDGHSTKPVTKVKALMSTTISILRKEGHPIVKIKRGRYGIRKEN